MSLNLLPSQAKFQMDKIKATALSRKIMTIFLITFIVITILVLGVEQGAKWVLNLQSNKYQSAMNSYLQSSTEIVTSQLIKFRAKLLGKVLADRFEYADAFGVVGNIFDPSIKVKDFDLKEKSFFVMTVIANSADSMKLLESRVVEINSGAESQIKKVVIKSVTYSKQTLEWLVEMEVFLK